VSDARDLPVSFSSFVVSLAASAMQHLGQTAEPDSGKREVNLPLARQTIDLIQVLKVKTEGNLDQEEQQLMNTLLDDLNAKYQAASQG